MKRKIVCPWRAVDETHYPTNEDAENAARRWVSKRRKGEWEWMGMGCRGFARQLMGFPFDPRNPPQVGDLIYVKHANVWYLGEVHRVTVSNLRVKLDSTTFPIIPFKLRGLMRVAKDPS